MQTVFLRLTAVCSCRWRCSVVMETVQLLSDGHVTADVGGSQRRTHKLDHPSTQNQTHAFDLDPNVPTSPNRNQTNGCHVGWRWSCGGLKDDLWLSRGSVVPLLSCRGSVPLCVIGFLTQQPQNGHGRFQTALNTWIVSWASPARVNSPRVIFGLVHGSSALLCSDTKHRRQTSRSKTTLMRNNLSLFLQIHSTLFSCHFNTILNHQLINGQSPCQRNHVV